MRGCLFWGFRGLAERDVITNRSEDVEDVMSWRRKARVHRSVIHGMLECEMLLGNVCGRSKGMEETGGRLWGSLGSRWKGGRSYEVCARNWMARCYFMVVVDGDVKHRGRMKRRRNFESEEGVCRDCCTG